MCNLCMYTNIGELYCIFETIRKLLTGDIIITSFDKQRNYETTSAFEDKDLNSPYLVTDDLKEFPTNTSLLTTLKFSRGTSKLHTGFIATTTKIPPKATSPLEGLFVTKAQNISCIVLKAGIRFTFNYHNASASKVRKR